MFFGLDELHLVGHGICKQLHKLLSGDYDVDNSTEKLSLSAATWGQISMDLTNSSNTIIHQDFDCALRLPSARRSHRSVDWLGLIMYVYPCLVIPRLPEESASVVMGMVKFIQQTQQFNITSSDLDDMDENLALFNQFITNAVNDKKIGKSFLTPNFHYLNHVTTVIKHLGALRYYSTRPIERTIGSMKQNVRAMRNSGKNAMNVLLQRAAIAHVDRLHCLKSKLLGNDNDDDDNGDEKDDNGDGNDDEDDDLDDEFSDDDEEDSDDVDSCNNAIFMGKVYEFNYQTVATQRLRFPIDIATLRQLITTKIDNTTHATFSAGSGIQYDGIEYSSTMKSSSKPYTMQFDIQSDSM